jgi:hypothetical protein
VVVVSLEPDTPQNFRMDPDDSQLATVGKLPANLNPRNMAMTLPWPELSLQLLVGGHVRLGLRDEEQQSR